MRNLAELFALRRSTSSAVRFGLVDEPGTYGATYDRSARLATLFGSLGMNAGQRAAVIGGTSRSFLPTWMALQLAGLETALINPAYPDSLLEEMLTNLRPDLVAWVGDEPRTTVCRTARHLDLRRAAAGVVATGGSEHRSPADPVGSLPGLDRAPSDTAGFMHTSGSTGTPKFCQQSHEYFLRLGRFVADTLVLTERDTVYAPLPFFHINPLGYGLIGALVAGAGVVGAERFSAGAFWGQVRDNAITVMVLHAPPVEILKRATTSADAEGHQVRAVFFSDGAFLDTFGIPVGVSAYGSTEAGGVCHAWLWRRGEPAAVPEGMSRYGGRSRHDVEWRLSSVGEIEVRGTRPGVLFDGYRSGAELIDPRDSDGWFPTGDLGRIDEAGNLVFIERMAESIRVKGEFVPIGYVEEHFGRLGCIDDVAIWRRPSTLVDDQVVLWVSSEGLDVDEIVAASAELPPFMRPSVVLRVAAIPRASGVGKIQRGLLDSAEVLESLSLS